MLKLLASIVALLTVISLFITRGKLKNSHSQNKPFPKKQVIMTVIGATFVIMVVIYEHYFFTFDRIARENAQQGLGPIMSSNGEYEAISYYEPYGGAAGGVNVWVEVKDVNKDSV